MFFRSMKQKSSKGLPRQSAMMRSRRCSIVRLEKEPSETMPHAAVIIETDIPARLDRLPWTRFHTLVVVALGITWVLDGLEVTVAGSIAGALQESPVLRFTGRRNRARRQCVSRGRDYWRGAVRLPDRPVRSQEALHGHARNLSDGDGRDSALLGFLELCGLSFFDRRRDWRRIHGDQLGDPGTDPGPFSRAHRSRDQRQFLAGRSIGRGRRHRLFASRRAAGGLGLASRLRDRRGAGIVIIRFANSFPKARAG